MNIAVFGATGFSGRVVVEKALKLHDVIALVRNPTAVGHRHERLKIVEGNVLDRQTVADVLTGCDAVIQCLGVGGKGTGKPTTFLSDATKIIVEEMQAQKIKRLIVMSNVGAGNSIAFLPWFFSRIILPHFMKWLQVIIDDKNRMEPIVMNSGLDWTIVRCPNITDKQATGIVNATLDGRGLKLSITVEDTAEFIVQQLVDDAFNKQAPSISN
jgi:putative NADH-flavin reductase